MESGRVLFVLLRCWFSECRLSECWFSECRFSRGWLALPLVIVLASLPGARVAADEGWSLNNGPGFEGGIVQDLALDPLDSKTLYMASLNGIFKSTDRAHTWNRLSPGLTGPSGLRHIGPRVLVADPQQAGVVYAAANAERGQHDGVFKTTDGGASWEGIGLSGERVENLLLVPSEPPALFAGTLRGGLFKHVADDQWTEVNDDLILVDGELPELTALAADPSNPQTLYLGTFPLGVYRSTDGGASWSDLNAGLPPNLLVRGGPVNDIAIDPNNPQRIFFIANNVGIFRSDDGGDVWQRVFQQAVLRDLEIDRNGAIHVAGDNYWRSAQGDIWEEIGPDEGNFNAIAVDPVNPEFYYLADSQFFGVRARRGHTTGDGVWANRGFYGRDSEVLAVRDGRIYAAARDLYWSDDGGSSWQDWGDAGRRYGPAIDLVVDPQDPSRLYVLVPFGVLRSDTSARTWTRVEGTQSYVFVDLEVAGDDPEVLYASSVFGDEIGGVYKSTDRALTWQKMTADPSMLSRHLAVVDRQTVYAATLGGQIIKTTDGGISWESRNFSGSISLSVTALVADPNNPETLYVGTDRNGVYRTTDGGASWVPVNHGLGDRRIRALAVDAADSNVVYAGTRGQGLMRSLDGGSTWNRFSDNLDYSDVTSIAVSDDGQPIVGFSPGPLALHQELEEICESGQTLCLQGGRFQVQVDWRAGPSGRGQVVPGATDDSGLFWFFSPNNWEILIKVLDGCGINGHYWVFAAATTDVEYTIRVTDTANGTVKTYFNPLGRSAPAITDSEAFATCP